MSFRPVDENDAIVPGAKLFVGDYQGLRGSGRRHEPGYSAHRPGAAGTGYVQPHRAGAGPWSRTGHLVLGESRSRSATSR